MKLSIVFYFSLATILFCNQPDCYAQVKPVGKINTEFGTFGYIDEKGADLTDGYGDHNEIFGAFYANNDNYDTTRLKTGIITADKWFVMRGGTISSKQILALSKIISEFYFENCTISSFFLEGEKVHFRMYFNNCQIQGAELMDAVIFEPINFYECSFSDGYGDIAFQNTRFRNTAGFHFSKFKNISFSEARFDKGVNFYGSSFKGQTNFDAMTVVGELNIEKTTFALPVDFRLSNLENVDKIYLGNIHFKSGTLYVNWNQFAAKDSFRIQSNYSPDDKEKKVIGIGKIYEVLKNNFDDQKDADAADDVGYELAQQKDKLLGNLTQKSYGIFFGYGFKPWRFVLFVFIPIVLIFSIIYLFQYKEIYPILYDEDDGESNNVSLLTKSIHVIYFSAWVLFSLRLNKDWIRKKNNIFNVLILLEYFLGILLFVIFAYLVASSRYGVIKSITGFG
jgi:hypothetical protein